MKRTYIVYAMLLAVLLNACSSPAAAPTIDAANVQNTAQAAAFTLVAKTQEALPTNTAVPPTDVPTETSVPTNTPEPLPTLEITSTSTLPPSTDVPTLAPTLSSDASNKCNHALTSWIVPTATFTIVNETKPQGKILLFLSVLTKANECGWINIFSTKFDAPMGSYGAVALVNGKKNFKVSGTFYATPQSWKIIVRNDRVVLQNACYPNC